jgi:aryl-alcohol dehydrogenase-like predicted oxidoreductase
MNSWNPFGPLTPLAESHAIMDRAHELGINFFDTSTIGSLSR